MKREDATHRDRSVGIVERVRCRAGTAVAMVLAVVATSCSQGTKSSKPDGTSRAAASPSAAVTTPRGRTVDAPASIVADCTADVTTELQAFITSVADGSTISLPHNACYRIDGTVVIAQRADLAINGNGATLKATIPGSGDRLAVRGRSQLSIVGSTSITVRNLVVRGANPHGGTSLEAYQPRYEAQHGFNVSNDDGVLLDGVQAYDTYGDFVYIGGPPTKPSRNITVAHSQFARSGRQGISITNADGVVIDGNRIDDVARSFIDIEPNIPTAEVRNVRITGNTTGAIRNYWLANKGVGNNIGDITANGNVMTGVSGGLVIAFGPKQGGRGPYTFSGNVFRTNGTITDEAARGAFLFSNTRAVIVSGNRISVAPAAQLVGVEFRNTDGATVRNNVFAGTTQPLIFDAASHNIHTS